MKDSLFKKRPRDSGKFTFNEEVVEVFDDMISRSVPFYSEVMRMCAELIRYFYQPVTNIYDLGCSTGNLIPLLLYEFKETPFKYVGVDSSPEMLHKAKDRYKKKHTHLSPFSFEKNKIQNIAIKNASVVVMNYTLQFIPPLERKKLLKNIFDSLSPNGVLLLSEKLIPENKVFYDFHIQFKKREGYSDIEIFRKKEALENVLQPLTLDENILQLKEVGFHKVEFFFRWYNFVSLLVIK